MKKIAPHAAAQVKKKNRRQAGNWNQRDLCDSPHAIYPIERRPREFGMKDEKIDHDRRREQRQRCNKYGDATEQFGIAQMRRRGDVHRDAFWAKRRQPKRSPISADAPDFAPMNPWDSR